MVAGRWHRRLKHLPSIYATPDPKLTRLFHCSDAGINRGSELISTAVAEASIPGLAPADAVAPARARRAVSQTLG